MKGVTSITPMYADGNNYQEYILALVNGATPFYTIVTIAYYRQQKYYLFTETSANTMIVSAYELNRSKRRILKSTAIIQDGYYHCDDGPALTTYHTNGSIKSLTYYQHGKIHKDNSPAELCYDTHGRLYFERYRLNNEPVRGAVPPYNYTSITYNANHTNIFVGDSPDGDCQPMTAWISKKDGSIGLYWPNYAAMNFAPAILNGILQPHRVQINDLEDCYKIHYQWTNDRGNLHNVDRPAAIVVTISKLSGEVTNLTYRYYENGNWLKRADGELKVLTSQVNNRLMTHGDVNFGVG